MKEYLIIADALIAIVVKPHNTTVEYRCYTLIEMSFSTYKRFQVSTTMAHSSGCQASSIYIFIPGVAYFINLRLPCSFANKQSQSPIG